MKVYCILGDERAFRTKSPSMFSAVMKKVGIRAAYVPFKVVPEQIGEAVQSLRASNIAGANVTVPYKEKVIPYLDILSEGANIIGAINTIVCTGETLKGYNTNAIGIMDALSESGFEAEGKSALILGTGGAAMAAAFIFNWLRTETIYISGRSESKGQKLVRRFGGESVPLSSLADNPPPVHIVINATSVSSTDESPEMSDLADKLELSGCELILDLNYGKTDNFWRKRAETRGIRFMDGLSPLAYQARRTFALWTGLQVPPEEFLKALDESKD